MELFEGRMIHSKSFRYEEHFDGLRVAVLGVHYSGEDIAMHIANYAKKVLLSSITSFYPSMLKKNSKQPCKAKNFEINVKGKK